MSRQRLWLLGARLEVETARKRPGELGAACGECGEKQCRLYLSDLSTMLTGTEACKNDTLAVQQSYS